MSTADDDSHSQSRSSPPIVGIGASAGGLEACEKLLHAAPPSSGLAFVLVMHLDPDRESNIAEILQHATPMPVAQVTEAQPVERDHVYVIAPGTQLTLEDNMLRPAQADEERFSRKPVDTLFTSLASGRGRRAIGVVLSGAGSDGSAGAVRIRDAGGLCIAQAPETAGYTSMPQGAVDAGAIHAVIPPEQIPQAILDHARSGGVPASRTAQSETTELPEGFGGILALLGRTYGLDFRDYKQGTLRRRTERRMGLLGIDSTAEYLDALRADPEELAALYGDLLIGVTQFFRDPESWTYLERHLVPELLEGHDEDRPVRAWVAGGATGEEAYGLAMVFLEHIERSGRPIRVQIYTTDVSSDAAAAARRGVYPASIASDLPEERLRRFFKPSGDYVQVADRVRDSVTVAVHNLLVDPPFSRMDLVSCRNVLIYLEPQAQARVLESLHFALRPKGVLWLGKSETVGARQDMFAPISEAQGFYRPLESMRPAPRRDPRWLREHAPLPMRAQPPNGGATPRVKGPTLARQVEQFVLQHHTEASVAVDDRLEILYFFGPTHGYLAPPAGEARLDLLSWARPGLYGKLRQALTEAVERNDTARVDRVRIERDGTSCRIACVVEPIPAPATSRPVFLVAFRDLPEVPERPAATEASGPDDSATVHQLEAELREARQEQKETLLQLESANEQYGASHEELVSLNEELQSSNEELETSKEELESLNEELVTVNQQLEEKNNQLRSANADLNNLLGSTGIATLFLDRQLNIRRFTPEAKSVMRLHPSDVGRSIEDIRAYVDDSDLAAKSRAVLQTLSPNEIEVHTRDRDRWYLRRVLPYRTDDDRIDGVCVTFHEITPQKHVAAMSERARKFFEAIVRSVRTPLLVLDGELTVVAANSAFYTTFAESESATLGRKIYHLGEGQWDIPELRRLFEQVLPERSEATDYEVSHEFATLGLRIMRVDAHALAGLEPDDQQILVSIEDVTDLLRARHLAEERADALADEHRRKDQFLAMLGHELRNPVNTIANALELQGRSGGDAARTEKLRAMMTRQTQRATTLLNQLLELSRMISGKIEIAREPVDLVDVAEQAIESQQAGIEEKRQRLDLELPARGEATVRGDSNRLVQIVENLLNNAHKYTPDDGHLRLSVTPTGDAVELSVGDDGIGIDADLLPHIFGIFTQAPTELARTTGGLGLGLPVVRHLVEMHGGEVDARSEGQDQGCEFIVRLPRLLDNGDAAAEPQRPDEPARASRPERARASRRVLVVEDERDAATTLQTLVETLGHDARAAESGREALELVETFQPDIVLLDLGLPGMDGYQVAARIRERAEKQPALIALTGYPADDSRLGAAGFDRHLLKPPGLETLTDVLDAPG